jgi:hypothetical protein
VLPGSSAAVLYSYMHIHICIIIKYNIYAPSRRICIFKQHRSPEPCVPGRASAAWSGRNTAHIRVDAPGSCRVSPKHRSCERRCCPAAQLPGLLFVPLIGGVTVLPGLHSYMHIHFCIIAPGVPGRAAAAWSLFNTAHARDGIGYYPAALLRVFIHICIYIYICIII